MWAEKIPTKIQFWDIAELLGKPIDKCPNEIKAAYVDNKIRKYPTFLEVRTLEGWIKGNRDCMLIMGVEGEFYPCKKGIFSKTYKILDEQTSGV